MPSLDHLNTLAAANAKAAFLRCCGSERWAQAMTEQRPFADRDALMTTADAVWQDLDPADWRESFGHHPRIGDIESLRAKFADTKAWAEGEQAGTTGASEAVLEALAEGNRAYEERFGYIFIVCATGKSAQEMLNLLRVRLHNDPDEELHIAAEEQRKITRLRLDKLLDI